jgi:peptidyl-prolyl cis-trans isomerase SurA
MSTLRTRAEWAVLALLGVAALTSCEKPVSSDVAATVNGRSISYTALDRAIALQFPDSTLKVTADQTAQLRLEVLRALIDQEIMLQRAEKEGLLASDADVDAKFNEYKAPYTKEELEKQFERRKMTESDFKVELRRQLSVEKLFAKEIGSHISISDNDVATFYRTNKANFNLPENKIRLAQILVTPTPDPGVTNLKNSKAQNDQEAKQKIQMIETKLRQGEDFASVASNYSEDDTASNGGDTGFIPESTLDKRANPELRRLILNMTPGQISQVIHTPEGYRIMKLISREMAGQRALNDPRVQEEIRQELFQAKQQMLRAAFYEVARSEAKITNYYARSVLDSRDTK